MADSRIELTSPPGSIHLSLHYFHPLGDHSQVGGVHDVRSSQVDDSSVVACGMTRAGRVGEACILEPRLDRPEGRVRPRLYLDSKKLAHVVEEKPTSRSESHCASICCDVVEMLQSRPSLGKGSICKASIVPYVSQRPSKESDGAKNPSGAIVSTTIGSDRRSNITPAPVAPAPWSAITRLSAK